MDARTRLLEHLVVEPGTAAGIADRDPGWTGGPDFADLAQDELEHRAKEALKRGNEEVVALKVHPERLEPLDLRWPEVSDEDHAANLAARRELDAEVAVH